MRNAVKKRMRKLDEERRKKQVEKIDNMQETENVLGMVGTEFITKYPEGSYITFTSDRKKGEEITQVSCAWYDKEGTKKNFVSNPPEWQNITQEEAEKIAKKFDQSMFLGMVYV